MEIKEVIIQHINFDEMKPENVFDWLDEFGFGRYGTRYFVKPSKRDDPRYPAERDESPEGWYTHLNIPRQFYDRDMFLIDKDTYEEIKAAFLKVATKTEEIK